MSKVLVLNGSPKKNGTVATLLHAVVEGVPRGTDVEWVDVYDLDVQDCIGCMRCRDGTGCRLAEDDGHRMARKIEEADALVVGTPTYWGNMSSPLLALFDRTLPVFIRDQPKGFPTPQLKGKKAVVVAACSTPWPWNIISAESRGAVREVWKGILKFAGYKLVGKVVQPGTKNGAELKGWSPCTSACPVHTPARDYVALIREGDLSAAFTAASEPNPFPAVCGRICTHPCETECTRGQVDEPIAIASLKRFLADWAVDHVPLPAPAPVKFEEKVAVIGAGPSGLSAARDLALLGYKVTVYEGRPEPGGMLRYGIPRYRLPLTALQQDIDRILALGIDLSCGQVAGRDFTVDGLLADGYSAVYLATGLQEGRSLGIPGAEGSGVMTAVDLLRDVALGATPDMGKDVLVIGGGDVAFDAARTALRLGAEKVVVTCIEDDVSMPASEEGIEEGLAEGLAFVCSCMPTAIVRGADGRPSKVEFLSCALGEPDERGWRPPVPIDGTQTERACDTVVLATGQGLAEDVLEGCAGVEVLKNQIVTDGETLMAGREGVFAGGDASARGPLTSIQAIAAGRSGARAIHDYLRGGPVLAVREPDRAIARPEESVLAATPLQARLAGPKVAADERRRSWDEVAGSYTEDEAHAEAVRCIDCVTCADWPTIQIPAKRLAEARALGAKL